MWRPALEMYPEGLIQRRRQGVEDKLWDCLSMEEVWRKKELPQENDPVKIAEPDEMHTYAGQKKLPVGYGLLLYRKSYEEFIPQKKRI